MIFQQQDIKAMEKRYRTNFINSLPGYKCLHMVGTINNLGTSNLALFNSIFHVGANPALLGMVVRPDAKDHDTLNNIKETKQYTLNNVLAKWYKQAHQTSARFQEGVSEFEPCGFEEYYLDGFKAPFVKQSSVRIGLKLREVIDVSINNTSIVIGEVMKVITDGDVVGEDGYVDPMKSESVTVAGLDSYFTAQALGRLSYAKPNIEPTQF